jgi:hypothetical protein
MMFFPRWTQRLLVGAVCLTAACDSGNWIAKAGPYTLTSEDFARIVADWQYFALREEEVERWAHRWVEWTLFVDRIARGDSLADSATVYEAVWPEVYELLFRDFQARILADSVPSSPEVIDSVYEAGAYRLIYHILLRSLPGASQVERRRTEAEMREIRARLLAGASFTDEAVHTQDAWAKERNGSLGVIKRGQMVPEFDSVAFALAPGAISDVFETAFGYHVAWRPLLDDVREEFTKGYGELRTMEIDSVFQANLFDMYELTFVDEAIEITRAAAHAPLKVIMSQEVIATYRGGSFTVTDLIRRMRMEPPDMRYDLRTKDDDYVRSQLEQLVQRELIIQAARDYGATLTPALDAELRFGHKQNVADVVENMQLDRFIDPEAPESELRRNVAAAVRDQFLQTAARERVPRFVPTYLSDRLRRDASWRVSDRGVAKVVELVTRMREEQ